jgi:YggT family protein
LLLARVLLSWFPAARHNALFKLLFSLTEPILAPIRSVIQKSPLGGPGMMLDFSPIIAFFLITLLQNILVGFLHTL